MGRNVRKSYAYKIKKMLIETNRIFGSPKLLKTPSLFSSIKLTDDEVTQIISEQIKRAG
jgi:hypothetical protein